MSDKKKSYDRSKRQFAPRVSRFLSKQGMRKNRNRHRLIGIKNRGKP